VFLQGCLDLTRLIYSPVDYIVDMPSRASTSQIREEDNSRVSTSYMKEGKRVDNVKIENHIITLDMDPTLSEMDFPNGEYIRSLHDKISHLYSELEKSKIPDKGKKKTRN
ncbi:hypothetical protein H5410_044825, partial [Solanum commersonii]